MSITSINLAASHLRILKRTGTSVKDVATCFRTIVVGLTGMTACVSGAHAASVSWGSELFSSFQDSAGNPLGNSFAIQLGFFEVTPGVAFTPEADNVADWVQHWRVFDQASLNLGLRYFTSEAQVKADGTSGSSFGTVGTDFEGQRAYIWVRNSGDRVPGSEWFLATADSWVFPTGSDDCCDPGLPVQFSITDLNPTTAPIWGGHTGNIGSGTYTDPNPTHPYTLQTYTFIPEPSTLVLTLVGSCLLLIRKRAHRLIPSHA